MDYEEFSFKLGAAEEFYRDLIIDKLAQFGFDSFEDLDDGFKAYIARDNISSDLNARIDQLRNEFSIDFEYSRQLIAAQNWNAVWESNFQPLWISGRCYVRASFHEARPDAGYEILIDPKMAFGTGHHQTTSLVMQMMLDMDFKGLKVLDMGCGTGILAILAAMMGAGRVVAIDYDPVCYESTVENIRLNGQPGIVPLCGSKEVIPRESFDIVLANINRNILLDQMGEYANRLSVGGTLVISGFYEEPDLAILRRRATELGLEYHHHSVMESWAATRFTRINNTQSTS